MLQNNYWRVLFEHDDRLACKKRETNRRDWCLFKKAFGQSKTLLRDGIDERLDSQVGVDGIQMLKIEAKTWRGVEQLIQTYRGAIEQDSVGSDTR